MVALKTALIKIRPQTREKMKQIATKSQTYDDLIVELIEFKEKMEFRK